MAQFVQIQMKIKYRLEENDKSYPTSDHVCEQSPLSMSLSGEETHSKQKHTSNPPSRSFPQINLNHPSSSFITWLSKTTVLCLAVLQLFLFSFDKPSSIRHTTAQPNDTALSHHSTRHHTNRLTKLRCLVHTSVMSCPSAWPLLLPLKSHTFQASAHCLWKDDKFQKVPLPKLPSATYNTCMHWQINKIWANEGSK